MARAGTNPHGAPRLSSRIPNIRPVIRATEPGEEFVATDVVAHRECDRDATDIENILQHLRNYGCVKQLERLHDAHTTRSVYRWQKDAYEWFEEYLEEMDTLPCGCRWHIPDFRKGADGMVKCKHCGNETPRPFFEEVVLDG